MCLGSNYPLCSTCGKLFVDTNFAGGGYITLKVGIPVRLLSSSIMSEDTDRSLIERLYSVYF